MQVKVTVYLDFRLMTFKRKNTIFSSHHGQSNMCIVYLLKNIYIYICVCVCVCVLYSICICVHLKQNFLSYKTKIHFYMIKPLKHSQEKKIQIFSYYTCTKRFQLYLAQILLLKV